MNCPIEEGSLVLIKRCNAFVTVPSEHFTSSLKEITHNWKIGINVGDWVWNKLSSESCVAVLLETNFESIWADTVFESTNTKCFQVKILHPEFGVMFCLIPETNCKCWEELLTELTP